MADESDISAEGLNEVNGAADDPSHQLLPPPELSYPDKQALMRGVQAHGKQHGYIVVVKTSSTPTEKKPGRAPKVWLRCDRGGTYRPRNGLTELNRKRKRSSKLIDCPFSVVGASSSGIWTVEVRNPGHNHGPSNETPRPHQPQRPEQGHVSAVPYDWPHDAGFSPFTCALVIVDMQRDFCEPGGYLDIQGHDISMAQSIIPGIQNLLFSFRAAGFPVYHTREGHRPDLSSLSAREKFRSENNATGLGIGSQGPLGRLLVRGEPGHDIIQELYPVEGEPIIDKPGHGAFAHTDFELLLRIKGIKNLIIAGVTTDVSVSTTMREANDRGFDCLLLEDGTGASEPNLHISTCNSIKMEGGVFGATGKIIDVIAAVDHFQQALGRPGTKDEGSSSSSTPRSPSASGDMMAQTLSDPQSSTMSLAANPMVPPFISQALDPNL